MQPSLFSVSGWSVCLWKCVIKESLYLYWCTAINLMSDLPNVWIEIFQKAQEEEHVDLLFQWIFHRYNYLFSSIFSIRSDGYNKKKIPYWILNVTQCRWRAVTFSFVNGSPFQCVVYHTVYSLMVSVLQRKAFPRNICLCREHLSFFFFFPLSEVHLCVRNRYLFVPFCGNYRYVVHTANGCLAS